MSLRRTPGVICQCQAGTPVDEGTLTRSWNGLPGPTGESVAARAAANTIYASVLSQTPVSMSWDSISLAAKVARTGDQSAIASSVGLSLSEAVYGFTVRQVAEQYLDVREQGSNRGTEVEAFLSESGGSAGNSWCAAFVSHCHHEAASFLCGSTTCTHTVRAVAMIFDGRDASNLTFSKQSVISGSVSPIAGDVMVMVTQGSVNALDAGRPRVLLKGHTGMVQSYFSSIEVLSTVEGNTDGSGSSNGDGVYQRTDRMSDNRLWGFMRPRIVWN
jgi:hypothetical protein